MEREYDTRIVIFAACFLIIVGFAFLFFSIKLLNTIGFLAIVIGSLIIISTGFNLLYKKNQELERKLDYILNRIEIKDDK